MTDVTRQYNITANLVQTNPRDADHVDRVAPFRRSPPPPTDSVRSRRRPAGVALDDDDNKLIE